MTTVRTPEFSSARDIRKRLILSTESSSSSADEAVPSSRNPDAERKYQERMRENQQQRNERLARDRQRKSVMRAKENDDQRISRLADQRHRSAINRLHESEQRRSVRLANMRQYSKASHDTETREDKLRRVRSMSLRRRQKITVMKQQMQTNRLHWPSPIPRQFKEHCLKDFIDQMSMKTLKQSTCAVCNSQASATTMNEYFFEDIPNRMRLEYHSDFVGIIPETGGITYKLFLIFNYLNVLIYMLSYRG
jgi:hypothetical protein